MLEFSALTRALSKLDDSPVVVSEELCLNRRHKDADCRRCVEFCPVQAISYGARIGIDADRCVACGLCRRICPTEAFALKAVDDGKLLMKIYSLLAKGDRVELACSRSLRDGDIRSDSSGILELTCLGQLSPALLIGSVMDGTEELWLNDSLCPECELRENHTLIKETLAITRGLLGAFGRKQSIFSYQDSPSLLSAKRAGSTPMKLRAGDTLYSRRDLLRSFSRGVARELVETASTLTEDIFSTSATAKMLVQHLPAQRAMLAHLLPKLGKPSVDSLNLGSLPMAQVKIGNQCSACGLCSRFCPTGALTSEVGQGQGEFTFAQIYCIACGLCQKVCPSDAIELSSEISTSKLVQRKPEVLMRCEMRPCAVCGTPCASKCAEPLCFVCAKKAEQQGPFLAHLRGNKP